MVDTLYIGKNPKGATELIKKFNANLDSNSGIVTNPSTIASGESVTIPAGRQAVVNNMSVDGELTIDGELGILGGGSISQTKVSIDNIEDRATSKNVDVVDLVKLDSGVLKDIDGNALSIPNTNSTNIYSAPQRGSITVDNDGSFDLNVTNNFSCTPAGTFVLTFTNISEGQSGQILLNNSGGHIITADTNTKVDANFLSTVSNAGVYVLGYFSSGTNVYVYNTGAME